MLKLNWQKKNDALLPALTRKFIIPSGQLVLSLHASALSLNFLTVNLSTTSEPPCFNWWNGTWGSCFHFAGWWHAQKGRRGCTRMHAHDTNTLTFPNWNKNYKCVLTFPNYNKSYKCVLTFANYNKNYKCVLTFPNYNKNYKCVSSQLYTTYIFNFNIVNFLAC